MTRLLRSLAWQCVALVCLAEAVLAADWTPAVAVRHEQQLCVSYRATLNEAMLIIQVTHEPGWHTYAMDNVRRAREKLNGKKSLGIDGPTEIKLLEGLKIDGPWFQSSPKDFSKPELRWFSWGFDGQSLFAVKVRRLDSSGARILIRGQACNESLCKNIDVEIPLPLPRQEIKAKLADVDLKDLIEVRE